jgi:Calcineurin-like phosphoesterase
MTSGDRNAGMVERIEATPVRYPFRFVCAGDSGAWDDPTADGIFSQLVSQVAALEPPPLFFANLGDFAGPGTPARHDHYLSLVEPLAVPNICVIGNHDIDDAGGWDTYLHVHGAVNFSFAYGRVRFVVLHSEPSVPGEMDVPSRPEGPEGPRENDLAYLEAQLAAAQEPTRIVLMHMPPDLSGHYAPHADWGFRQREREFLHLLHAHGVTLVVCAHGLAFDTVVRDGVRFVMSGGGGTGLCSHYRGVCTAGDRHPEDRGAFFHAVEIEVGADGAIAGLVIQAFDRSNEAARLRF